MTRSLVTGAGGFIGSHLVDELLDRGHTVRGFDNFSTGNPERVARFSDADDFEFVGGDLRESDDVRGAITDVDYVFHQAAIPSVPRSVENPQLTTKANCLGTTNLLNAARDEDVDSVVVASSSSVYGSGGELPKREDQPENPESPYALSKYWTEKLAIQYSELYGLETAALRYFNIFGPGQDPSSEYAAVVPKFIHRMIGGERPVIYGDGGQSRDFTFIENAVEANVLAATNDCSGEAFNVGCGGRTTVNELVATLNEVIGTDLDPIYDDTRPGDVRHSHADISKAHDMLGYDPIVGFEEGIRRAVDSMHE